MGSLLDVNLDDVQELKVLADNTEARLRILRAEVTPNRSDPSRSNLALVFDVPEEPMVDDIRMWLPIPDDDQKRADQKRYIKAMERFKEFIQAFDVQMPVNTEDLQGLQGWAILREEEDQNGSPTNGIRRFVKSQ